MRYFKKEGQGRVYLPNGARVLFETVDHDTSVFPPEGKAASDAISQELAKLIKLRQGAVEEISHSEYAALIAKKNSGRLKAPWREELKPSGPMGDTGSGGRVRAAVAAIETIRPKSGDAPPPTSVPTVRKR